mgnify:CR=1 FL=1
MAYQNVGNPKFYIDSLSYWKAKGDISDVTYGSINNAMNLIGLNPSSYIYEAQTFPHDIKISFPQVAYQPKEATDKFFMGFFGHNFADLDLETISLQSSNSSGTVYDVGSVNADSITVDEICNWRDWSGASGVFNGWSMGEWTGGHNDTFDEIKFTINRTATSASTNILGCVAFGYIFQMPHSPDLKLTMTREYEGIKETATVGGNTLTQIDYYAAPHWAGYPAWHLSDANVKTYIDTNFKENREPARGRRVWDLKFSYVSDTDIMPINEMLSIKNPTDSNTNDLARYNTNTQGTSGDFNSSGNFSSDHRRDTSWMSAVMEKTIGGALPFIFQPDGNNNSPDQFAICQLDQSSFKFKQVAHNVWDISLKIREVW